MVRGFRCLSTSGRQPDVVLPSAEQIPRTAKVRFVNLPDVLTDIDNIPLTANCFQRFDYPRLEILSGCHAKPRRV